MDITPKKIRPYINNESQLPILNITNTRVGASYYRMYWPHYMFNINNIVNSHYKVGLEQDLRLLESLVSCKVQYTAHPQLLDYYHQLHKLCECNKTKMMFDCDDLLFSEYIPDFNPAKPIYVESRPKIIDLIEKMDEVIVATEYLKEIFLSTVKNKKITVVKNYIPRFWFGDIYNYNDASDNYSELLDGKIKPRILWAPAGSHLSKDGSVDDDATHIKDVIRKTVDKYEWIIMGHVPYHLIDLAKEGKIQVKPYVKLIEYPRVIKGIKPHFIIAPLHDNEFNRSKSDIKILEANCIGVVSLTQDLEPYEDNFENCKFKTGDELIDAIETNLTYENTIGRINERRSIAEKRFIELPENINRFAEVAATNFGSKRKFNIV